MVVRTLEVRERVMARNDELAPEVRRRLAAAGVAPSTRSPGPREWEAVLPVPPAARGACGMLGLDPLYVANEGILVAIVAPEAAELALGAMPAHPLGAEARQVGHAVESHPGLVTLKTSLGGSRIVDLLPGDQLPRIC